MALGRPRPGGETPLTLYRLRQTLARSRRPSSRRRVSLLAVTALAAAVVGHQVASGERREAGVHCRQWRPRATDDPGTASAPDAALLARQLLRRAAERPRTRALALPITKPHRRRGGLRPLPAPAGPAAPAGACRCCAGPAPRRPDRQRAAALRTKPGRRRGRSLRRGAPAGRAPAKEAAPSLLPARRDPVPAAAVGSRRLARVAAVRPAQRRKA